MLDSILYHKIAIDSSICNKFYQCAPIVCRVIFFNASLSVKLHLLVLVGVLLLLLVVVLVVVVVTGGKQSQLLVRLGLSC